MAPSKHSVKMLLSIADSDSLLVSSEHISDITQSKISGYYKNRMQQFNILYFDMIYLQLTELT